VVLSAGNHPVLPPDLGGGTPSVTLPTKAKVEQRQEAQQTLVARKAPFGSSRVIDGAGSYIRYWDPVAVIDAMRSVLADPRGNNPPTSR
jgi:hypothetical protein